MNFLTRFLSPSTAIQADSVDPSEAQRRQQAGALLVDVRESDEWQRGHASGAKHVPLGQLKGRLGELPPGREVLLICQSGARSASAQRVLLAQGFQATNVRGGTSAWNRAGLPIAR